MNAGAALELGVIVVVAAAISAGLIVVLKPLLIRYALARPNARSSHKIPTPQGGGMAVIAATFAGALVAVAIAMLDTTTLVAFAPLAAGTTLLALVGAVDDIRELAIVPRLALQFLAVGLAVAALPAEARVVPFLPWWIERALALVAGVYLVNLVNFMDGIDWMSVAEVVPLAAGVILLGFVIELPPLVVVTAAALAGGMLGFAPFNRPVAKLFLGDVGSLPSGLLLFWLLSQLAVRGHVVPALLLPLYYLADATVTLARRLLRGENITQAHRAHYYQRALDHGWSVPQVVRHVFVLNIFLTILAMVAAASASVGVALGALALGIGAVGALLHRLQRG